MVHEDVVIFFLKLRSRLTVIDFYTVLALKGLKVLKIVKVVCFYVKVVS